MLNKIKAYLAAKIAVLAPQPSYVDVAPLPTTKETHMAFQITDTQKRTLTVGGLTAAQNQVAFTGLAATTSDASVLNVAVNPDGLSVDVAAVGKLGTASVMLTVGAVAQVFDFEVVVGELASLSVTTGEAVAK